jgi:hypothetical protein
MVSVFMTEVLWFSFFYLNSIVLIPYFCHSLNAIIEIEVLLQQ